MAHLRKGPTGHLWRSSGHLVKKYICPSGTENSCNACSPPIPDTLYMTWANLGADFAAYNGKSTLVWVSGCIWERADGKVSVRWRAGNQWLALAGAYADIGSCARSHNKSGSSCDPTGSFAQLTCVDSGCIDTDSCLACSDSTCVVSTS